MATAPKYDQKKMAADALMSLQRRYRSQKSQRSSMNSVWDEIEYYTGPIKNEGSTADNPAGGTDAGLESKRDLWDFTAIDGREKLSASIYTNAMGSAYRFYFLTHRDPNVNRDQECAEWLSTESEGTWNDLQASDFNTEAPAALHEDVGLGNCFMSMEQLPGSIETQDRLNKAGRKIGETVKESWEGVDFSAIPLRDCYFEPDRKNMVKTFWRRYSWAPSQIIDWCEDNNVPVPEDVQEKFQKGSDVKIEIVFCKFERPEILKRKKMKYPAVPTERPYGYVWWREDSREQLGDEGGYYQRTVYKGIWSKSPGSKWGHGLGHIALPTIKYVNGWKEQVRAAGEKAIDPSWVTTERNILSDVDMRAAGMTIVRDVEKLKPLESAAKFDVSKDMLLDDQKMIRQIFHVDDLQLKDSPAMTATEAQIRYEWMMKLLGKTLTFIQSYLLEPIIIDLLAMRIQAGAAKPMPKMMRDAGGIVNIEFQGPLARSQRTDEVAAIERGAAFVAGMAQFYPEVRACIDPLETVKLVFQRLGIPANVMPPDAVLRKKMKEITDSMQQAQAADTNQKNADANHKNAAADEKRGGGGTGQPSGLGGTPGPVVYPGLPPKPNLAPNGQVAGGRGQ